MLGNFWKTGETDRSPTDNGMRDGSDYAVSKRPLIPREAYRQTWHDRSRGYENLGELPRSYGQPIFFGIARDPHTLFTYWEIDWPTAFGDKPPKDRKVYLRTLSKDGLEETRVAVEPLAGSHTVSVANAGGTYQIELGYDEPADVWNSVAISGTIATPPDDVSANSVIDVATIPFHMSFQRLIDSFRAAKYDENALAKIIADLQRRADDQPEMTLSVVEREVLRAIECTLSKTEVLQRSQLRDSADSLLTRQRVEAILGFGGSSRT